VYAAIRQYELGAGSVQDFMQITAAGFADRLSQLPGFVSYQLLATGSDEIVSITLFRDEEAAVRSNELAADFVRERLQQFQLNLTSSLNGEVQVQRGSAFEHATA
jgi:Antibiotic biosynthesis monooxygenase